MTPKHSVSVMVFTQLDISGYTQKTVAACNDCEWEAPERYNLLQSEKDAKEHGKLIK